MTIEDAEYEDDSDGIDPADLAGELDDEPPDDLPDDEIDDDFEIFTGTARGGPIDGETVDSRFPKGFLLVDMEREQVWIYDRQDDGSFKVRNELPSEMLDEGDDNRWRAADEGDYDILVPDMAAASDEGGGE